MITSHFNLTGLTCEACVKLVNKRLGTISGVKQASAELPGHVTLSADREVTKEEIGKALEGTDYRVQ